MPITKRSIFASRSSLRACLGRHWLTPLSQPDARETQDSTRQVRLIGCKAVPSRCSSIGHGDQKVSVDRVLRSVLGSTTTQTSAPWARAALVQGHEGKMRRHHETPFGAELTSAGVGMRSVCVAYQVLGSKSGQYRVVNGRWLI